MTMLILPSSSASFAAHVLAFTSTLLFKMCGIATSTCMLTAASASSISTLTSSVCRSHGPGSWSGRVVSSRTMKSVVLPEGQGERLLSDARRFLEREQWCVATVLCWPSRLYRLAGRLGRELYARNERSNYSSTTMIVCGRG